MYFASHFHNWYVQATDTEIARYLEDIALWGVNVVKVIFPMINLQGWSDPEAGPALEMVRKYARAARALGIRFATGLNNCMFIGAPANIRAKRLADPTHRRGNSGHPICPTGQDSSNRLERCGKGGRAMKEKVQEAINKIRPMLQRDGGDVELVDVKDGIVTVRLRGACAGCPMSQMTLKNGIEKFLKREIPEIVSVQPAP
jgi:Fe-S cluster biogenesis protein NfuA